MIAKLEATNNEMEATRQGDTFSDPKAAYELDKQFHILLVDASKHTALQEWYERLNAQVQIIRLSSWNIGPRGKKTIKEHKAIIQALKKKEFVAIQSAIENHLDSML